MLKRASITRLLLIVAAVSVIAAPASAQLTFEAEIDCGDDWNPGDVVPFTVRFEEQAFTNHDLDVLVEINVPGRAPITLFDGMLMLGPNQDIDFNRDLNLPNSAPRGDYQMSVTADDGAMVAFDTCSFDVN